MSQKQSQGTDDVPSTRERGPSHIEMLDPPSTNRPAGSSVISNLNSTMISQDESNYESFGDQLNHTMSEFRGSVDNNNITSNFRTNPNQSQSAITATDSLRMNTMSTARGNDLTNGVVSGIGAQLRNASNSNQSNQSNVNTNGISDKHKRKKTDDKRAISGYRNDEMIVRNTSDSLYSKHQIDEMINEAKMNDKDNGNNNNNIHSDDILDNTKPRIKRIASEPNQLLSSQLAEFQHKQPSKKSETKRMSLTDWWNGTGVRSSPYHLMEDNTNYEPTLLTTTATLHPAKAGHQYLGDVTAKSKFERLDFDLQESQIKHRMTWKTRKHDSRGFTKWALCLFIGVCTGTTMFCVVICIDAIKDWNTDYTEHGFKQIGVLTGFVRFFAINILCALIAGMLVSYVAPAAAGSGIPSVKAWLNGSYIPTLFDLKTLIVKLVGIAFSVSGFFVVGKEGPMVHTGSALASGLALGRNKTLGIDSGLNHSFRNDADARDLISCGAAAGVSAAFGAPIGGMLFALEEVSSFWQPGLTWRAFFTSATSNFVLQLWLGCYQLQCGEVSKASLISFEADSDIVDGLYNMKEFIFFVIMGFVGGIVGMFFNAINVQLCVWRKEYLQSRLSKVIEVLVVGAITTILLSLTPLMFGCEDTDIDKDSCKDPYDYGKYTCESGKWNPLASLFMVSSEDVIAALFHQQSKCWRASTLMLSAFIYFILAVVTYGISIPSGLFVPLILIGSNLGHSMGIMWNDLWDDDFDVGTYALIGASAVLGGSTRMTISLTAIILEITNDIYYLMPIMTTIMVAKWVGDRFNSALYDSHVGLKDIPYLEPKVPSWVPSYICADDVMKDTVTTLPIIINLEQMLRILNDPQEYHNAFPIIESKSKLSYGITSKHGWKQRDGRFVGIILRWHILIMISKKLYSKSIDQLSNLPLLNVEDITDRSHKGDRLVTRDIYKLPPKREWKEYYMDLSPYMSLSPHSINRSAPIRRVYHMFRAFGMRHLVVLDKQQLIAGIITSHELLESNLEHVVERVHLLFDYDPNKSDELFEERIKFLTGQTSRLRTSGNEKNPRYIAIEQQLAQNGGGHNNGHDSGGTTPLLGSHGKNGKNGQNDNNNNNNGNRNGATTRHLMSLSTVKTHSKNTSNSNNKDKSSIPTTQKTPIFDPIGQSQMSIMDIVDNSPSRTPTIQDSPDTESRVLEGDLIDALTLGGKNNTSIN